MVIPSARDTRFMFKIFHRKDTKKVLKIIILLFVKDNLVMLVFLFTNYIRLMTYFPLST